MIRFFLFLLSLFFTLAAWAAPAAPRQPINLLFIITDQQRWDTLGCTGNPVIHTPNLDRLAREGARFTNAYSSCPVCVPARTAILTGHCVESNRVMKNEDLDVADLSGLPAPSIKSSCVQRAPRMNTMGNITAHAAMRWSIRSPSGGRRGRNGRKLIEGGYVGIRSVLEIRRRACARAPAPARRATGQHIQPPAPP